MSDNSNNNADGGHCCHGEHHHEHHHHEHCCHEHSHAASSPEEALALLKYMLDHNRHHAEELHDLAHSFDESAADLLHEAVDRLYESNELIEQALSLITDGSN